MAKPRIVGEVRCEMSGQPECRFLLWRNSIGEDCWGCVSVGHADQGSCESHRELVSLTLAAAASGAEMPPFRHVVLREGALGWIHKDSPAACWIQWAGVWQSRTPEEIQWEYESNDPLEDL